MNKFTSAFAGRIDPLYIISIWLLICVHPSVSQVTKCCELGKSLQIQNNSDYSCAESINDESWDAYNVRSTSIPNCSPSTVIENVFEDLSAELSGCIDRDENDQFVAISCPQSPKTTVHLVNKCCPTGLSYDQTGRNCVENSDLRADFQHLFGHSAVIFQYSVPNCTDDEVFVEYFSTVHSIRFVGRNLKVNGDSISPDKYCVEDLVNIDPNDVSENEKHYIIRSCRPRTVCDQIPCVQRCCRADQVMKSRPRRCEPHPNNTNLLPIFHDVTLPLTNEQKRTVLKDYGVVQHMKCKKIYPLMPNENPDDLHYIHKNGKLYTMNQEPYSVGEYCIENIPTTHGGFKAVTFLCFAEPTIETKFHYYPYGLSISCVFLAATLVVYLSLPKLLNIHGKTLVCYVFALLAAYTLLAVVQFQQVNRSRFCYEAAFILLFCFIASFCWQTVMCFDIWLTFGSLRSSFMMRHNRQSHRKFLYYSTYAWGVPLTWTMFTLYADNNSPLPDGWNPVIAEETCFFNNHVNVKIYFLYFLVPVGLHVIANCVFFVITSIHCSRVKSDIHRMQRMSDESASTTKRKKFLVSRAIFIMNLKLFTVMGISWILETISTYATANDTLEMILDLYNIFLGVLIFFIFVFKRKVLYELKCRFGFQPRSTETATPRSTTVTNTINMKDMTASEKNLPLLTSSATLQVPSIRR